MASVKRPQKLPSRQTEPVPAGFKMDPPQAKAEPQNNVSSASTHEISHHFFSPCWGGGLRADWWAPSGQGQLTIYSYSSECEAKTCIHQGISKELLKSGQKCGS